MVKEDYFYYFNRHGYEFVPDHKDAAELKNLLDEHDLDYKISYESDDNAGYLFEKGVYGFCGICGKETKLGSGLKCEECGR